MQALGSYKGGRMLFLGLGTGLGSAMIIDGVLQPMELAHLPYRKATYEDYVGLRGIERYGKKKWRKHVFDVVAKLTVCARARRCRAGRRQCKENQSAAAEVPRRRQRQRLSLVAFACGKPRNRWRSTPSCLRSQFAVHGCPRQRRPRNNDRRNVARIRNRAARTVGISTIDGSEPHHDSLVSADSPDLIALIEEACNRIYTVARPTPVARLPRDPRIPASYARLRQDGAAAGDRILSSCGERRTRSSACLPNQQAVAW